MITVWGTPIVATVEQVINDLKLERFTDGLLKDINNTGADLMCTCPFHKGGKEKRPSCGILLKEKIDGMRKYEAGTVHCYTCGYTADLPQFISDFLDLGSPLAGFKWLVSHYNYSAVERAPLELDLYRGQAQAGTCMDDADVEHYHRELLNSEAGCSYLYRRGLSDWLIDAFKLGFDPVDNVVLFPVRDAAGKVAFYKGRSIVGKHFYNAKNVDKNAFVFGLYELCNKRFSQGKANENSEVWITESEIDALSLIDRGEFAISIMGSHISEAQCRALEGTPFRRYVLALDNDDAGRKGASQVKKMLIPKGFRFTNLQWETPAKDINDLVRLYGDNWKTYLKKF